MKRIRGIKLGLALALVVLLVGVVSVTADVPQGGTLRVAIRNDVQNFDPAYLVDATTSGVSFSVYEHIVARSYDGVISPGLSESWEISENADVYTFNLRRGVKFHDGSDFNAQAVKFNFDRIMDPEVASHAGELLRSNIDEIVIEDDYTIVFYLTEPNAAFIDDVLLQNATFLASPTAIETLGEQLSRNPVGTGAFKFHSWTPDTEVVLARNEDYWDGAPNIDRIVFRPIPEPTTQLTELRTGRIHFMTVVPVEQKAAIEADPNINVIGEPDFNVRYLVFNFNQEVFQDINVRRGLHYALDINELVEIFLEGVAERAYGPLPNMSPFHNPDVLEYPYNPDKALATLALSGWARGSDGLLRNEDGETLKFTLTTPLGRYTKDRELNEAIHFQFRQIGVDVDIEIVEFATLIDKLRARDFDLAYIGLMQRTGDPTAHLDLMYHSEGWANWGDYNNPEIDDLLNQGKRTGDPDERMRIYAIAQDLIMEDAPTIPIMNEFYLLAYRTEVKNYTFGVARPMDYSKLYLGE